MNKIKNFIINEEHPVKYIFVISLIIAATIPTTEIDKIPFSWKLIVEILKLVDFSITRAELGAIFRNKEHENFKPCGDQILRNFLNGLIIYKRGPKPE